MMSMFSKRADVRDQTHTSQPEAKSRTTKDPFDVPLRIVFTQNSRCSGSGSVSHDEDEEVLFPGNVSR
jgi:hypothetical protein